MEHLRVLHTFIGSKPFDRRRSFVLWDRINGEYVVLMLDDGNNHVLVPSGPVSYTHLTLPTILLV